MCDVDPLHHHRSWWPGALSGAYILSYRILNPRFSSTFNNRGKSEVAV